jgi:hypothetical protein
LPHAVELINASFTDERDASKSQYFFIRKIMQEISRKGGDHRSVARGEINSIEFQLRISLKLMVPATSRSQNIGFEKERISTPLRAEPVIWSPTELIRAPHAERYATCIPKIKQPQGRSTRLMAATISMQAM